MRILKFFEGFLLGCLSAILCLGLGVIMLLILTAVPFYMARKCFTENKHFHEINWNTDKKTKKATNLRV